MKTLPLWLKAIIGVVVVGGGVMVLANIGTSLFRSFLGKKVSEMGIEADKTGEMDVEKLLEGAFKKSGINIDLDTKKGGFAIKDEKTGATQFGVGGSSLPRDFPTDIPVFQPSTVASSMMLGPNKSVQLETDKPLEEVTAFYKNAMAERDWLEDHAVQAFGNQPYTTNWVKGHRRVAIIATPPEDGKTLIIINTSQSTQEQAGDPSLLRVDEKELPALQKDMQHFIKELDKLQRAPLPEPKAPVPSK